MKKKKMLLGVSTLLVVSLIMTGCGKEIEVKNGLIIAIKP